MASLSDATIRAFPTPEKGQKLYTDPGLPGFGVRVSAGGTKSFVLQLGSDRQKITLGRYGIVSLAQARDEAKRILAERTLGKVRPQGMTYSRAVTLFLEDKSEVRRSRTVNDYKRLLGRLDFTGHVSNISPDEFARKLKKITAPSERAHILTASRVFFNWARKRRMLDHDPTLGLSKPQSKPRERVLSPDEIRALWHVPGTFPDYIRGLLLTGQRRSELRYAVIEADRFTIPSEFSKNHRAHTVPILPMARPFIKPYPNFSWGKDKDALDEASGVHDWQIRDCRRTFRSGMSQLGVLPHVAERLLNHITGQSPLERVYDRYAYFEEMKAALEKWEAHIQELLR